MTILHPLEVVGRGNFHPLEVVGRGSETQLQVGENLMNFMIYHNKTKLSFDKLQLLFVMVRFTLNSSTRIIEFRGFLGQISTWRNFQG